MADTGANPGSSVNLTEGTGDASRVELTARTLEAIVLALPLLVATSYFKYWELRYRGADAIVTKLSHGTLVGALGPVGPFVPDLAECLVLVPLLVVAIGAVLPRRRRLLAGFVICQSLLLLGTLAWIAAVAIGRLPSTGLISDYFRAALRDPGLVDPRGVVAPRVWAKGGVIALLGPLALILAGRLRATSRRAWMPSPARFAALLLMLVALATIGASQPARTSWNRGWFPRIFSALFVSEEANDEPLPAGFPAIAARYQASFGAGASLQLPRRKGVHKLADHTRPNIILVILETAPERDYPVGDPQRFPHLARLLPASIVAHNHFSASPSSSRSDFTILTSLYDGPDPTSPPLLLFQRQAPKWRGPLPAILAEHGYSTRYYYPGNFTLPEDEWFVNWAGFGKVQIRPTEGLYRMQSVQMRVEAERDLYRRAIADLPNGPSLTPFFTVVRSLIGHYPIIDPRAVNDSAGAGGTIRDRLRALTSFEDGLLGQLIDTLDHRRLLSKTIIVVTGDHGLRTLGEDPTLDLSVLNERTFHVPLIVYDPMALDSTLDVYAPTSHIDITPTILALAGIPDSEYLHLGRAIWDPELASRPVCFASEFQGGTSGCVANHQYYMESPQGGLAFLADSFHFTPENLVQTDVAPGAVRRFHLDLATLRLVRAAWMAAMLFPAPQHPAPATSSAP